ncbi:MAG: PKD domain-containing protein [Thermodesulfobacteriota bacterium]
MIKVRMVTDGGGIVAQDISKSIIIIPVSAESSIQLTAPKPDPYCDNPVILQGGQSYDITWDASGCDLYSPFVSIRFASDGTNYESVQPPYSLPISCYHRKYNWQVPNIETTTGRIRIEWDGHTSSHVYNFSILASANQPPAADAGEDQTVAEETLVYLDGSGSSDPEGDSLQYHWEIMNPTGYYESLVNLVDANSVRARFTAPNVPVEVPLTFRLTVTDPEGSGQSRSDTVIIRVTPNATRITRLTPTEGFFKTPVTLEGENLGGSDIFMHGRKVSDVPIEENNTHTFSLPDLPFGSTPVTLTTPTGSSVTAISRFTVSEIPYQWRWGFEFANPSGFFLGWSDMERCFGERDVTIGLLCDGGSRRCHRPTAQKIFDGYVRSMAFPGSCYGVSVASLKFYSGNFDLNDFSTGDSVRELEFQNDPMTAIAREIRRLHISQISAEVIEYLVDHINETPVEVVARIDADTAFGDRTDPDYRPGIISIQNIFGGMSLPNDLAGHSMVPDHVEQVGPDEWRIYVYDSNRPGFSTSLDNFNHDDFGRITDWSNYPYITVIGNESDQLWTYDMSGDGSNVWRGRTDYTIRIETNRNEIVIPFYGLYYFPHDIVNQSRYTFPTTLRGLFMILTGSANTGIRDRDGKLLGYDNAGKLHFDIAGGIPIVPLSQSGFSRNEGYYLPDDEYTVTILGEKEGLYNWQCMKGERLFAIESTPILKGGQDTVTLDAAGSSIRLQTDHPDKPFSAKLVKPIPADKPAGIKIYEISESRIGAGEEAEMTTTSKDAFVYRNRSDRTVRFDLNIGYAQLGPQPEPPDAEDHILTLSAMEVPPQTSLIITPKDWNFLSSSQYTVSTEPADSADPGDIDDDGRVELDDAIRALQIVAGLPVTDAVQSADVDNDQKLGLPEALFILRHISSSN